MTTFADYVASKPAMDEQISNIESYTVMLCDALYLDAKYRARRHHTNAIAHIEGDTFKGDKEYERAYHIRKIHEIDNQGVDYEFYIKPGRKYHKVMMRTGSSLVASMLLLIKRLVMFSKQHQSMLLLRV